MLTNFRNSFTDRLRSKFLGILL